MDIALLRHALPTRRNQPDGWEWQ